MSVSHAMGLRNQRILLRDLVDQLQHSQPLLSIKKPKEVKVDVREVKRGLKASWKDGGHCDTVFGEVNPLKGKDLSPWQLQRIPLSKRSYSSPKTFKGMKSDSQSRLFVINEKQRIYSSKFKKYLDRVEKQYEDKIFTFRRDEKKEGHLKMLKTEPMKFSTGINFFGSPKIKQNTSSGFRSYKSAVFKRTKKDIVS